LWRFCTSNSLSLISPRMVGRTSTEDSRPPNSVEEEAAGVQAHKLDGQVQISQLYRRRSSWCLLWMLYRFSSLGCCLLHIAVC
jgi:hypothetical protein